MPKVLTPKTRLEKFRTKLQAEKLDGFLVSKTENRHYLTGWQGDSESGYLLITSKRAFIFTDSRYTEDVVRQVKDFELVEYSGRIAEFLGNFFKDNNLTSVGFESHDLSVFLFSQIKKASRGVKLVPVAHFAEDLRVVKDEAEIVLMKKSAKIASDAFNYIKTNVKVDMTERQVALEMEKFMKDRGAQKNAWDPFIVAAGANSSIVHYAAGDKRIKKGDMVQLDWGCVYNGYACDISRVLFIGQPSEKQLQVYNLVLGAQKAGIASIKIGRETRESDVAAREFLAGKTDFAFRHTIGHGVGLEVHELPRINSLSTTVFEEGQVITIEPGIYEPGWGGVRIEDTILVTASGPKSLSTPPKDLKSIIVG